MTDVVEVSELAQQHDDDPTGPPLFGTVRFVEAFDAEGGLLHLCRDADSNVLLYATVFGAASEVSVLDEVGVRWLAGVFAAALDNWPRP